MLNKEQLLKAEIKRLNATDIELVYSVDSAEEFELINNKEGLETTDLNILATLDQLQLLSDNAGSDTFWYAVRDGVKL